MRNALAFALCFVTFVKGKCPDFEQSTSTNYTKMATDNNGIWHVKMVCDAPAFKHIASQWSKYELQADGTVNLIIYYKDFGDKEYKVFARSHERDESAKEKVKGRILGESYCSLGNTYTTMMTLFLYQKPKFVYILLCDVSTGDDNTVARMVLLDKIRDLTEAEKQTVAECEKKYIGTNGGSLRTLE